MHLQNIKIVQLDFLQWKTNKIKKLNKYFLGLKNPLSFTFTFMHLADAFIQSDLQCIHAIHFLSVCYYYYYYYF